MTDTVGPTQIIEISQEDYDNYQYHKNMICILERLSKREASLNQTQIEYLQKKLAKSESIVKKIEDEIWMINKEKKSFLSKATLARLQEVEEYLTFINMERIYLGITRNIYTFATQFTPFNSSAKEINTDSSLLASYLYPLRIIIFLLKAATISWNNKTDLFLYKGFVSVHWQRLLNDIVWTILLIGLTLSVYLTDAASQAFFQNELTGMITSIIVLAGFLFDAWNAGTPSRQLAKDWKKFKTESAEGLDCTVEKFPNELDLCYQEELIKRNVRVAELCAFCGLYFSYALINAIKFGLSANHQLTHAASIAFPWIDFALTVLMLGARVYFIFHEYFSPEFQNLSDKERASKLKEMWFTFGKELLKIALLAIVIFVIASQLHLAVIPGMLALGAITFGLITLSNMLVDLAKKYTPDVWFQPISKDAALH